MWSESFGWHHFPSDTFRVETGYGSDEEGSLLFIFLTTFPFVGLAITKVDLFQCVVVGYSGCRLTLTATLLPSCVVDGVPNTASLVLHVFHRSEMHWSDRSVRWPNTGWFYALFSSDLLILTGPFLFSCLWTLMFFWTRLMTWYSTRYYPWRLYRKCCLRDTNVVLAVTLEASRAVFPSPEYVP